MQLRTKLKVFIPFDCVRRYKCSAGWNQLCWKQPNKVVGDIINDADTDAADSSNDDESFLIRMCRPIVGAKSHLKIRLSLEKRCLIHFYYTVCKYVPIW